MINQNLLSAKPALYYTNSVEKGVTLLEENKKKIDDLQKALDYAEAIVTTIPTPLIILYPALYVKTANKAFYKTFDLSVEETEGKLIYELANGQWDVPLLKKLLEDILPKKNVLTNFEVNHSFRGMGNKIMLLNARILFINKDYEPMILLSIEDITEERSIEKAVEKERKTVLQNIPSGLLTLDKEWRFIYCNKRTEFILGKKLEDIEGRNIWKILPDLVNSTFDKNCCKALKSGKPAVFEQFFSNLNSWFQVLAFSSADGLSIYLDDITKHKKAKEIVEAERKKMFNLLMNAPAVICVFSGPEHRFILANNPYMQMVGTKRNLIGLPIKTALPELKDQGVYETLDEVYKTGKPFIGKEMHIKLYSSSTKKKEAKVLSVVFEPYSDTDGKVEGIISYASDITTLVTKRNDIEELLKQKDEFIGVASHELKTPVTSIKGYTQILQMRFAKEGNTKAVDLLARMDAQINKLNNLVSDLLDVTKIERGKLQYHEAFFDFNELVMEVVEEMQQISQRHAIILKLGLTTNIYGDKDRIGQVITNFISNAIKYSPENGEIIITTLQEKNAISLSVQDFGIGIPAQKQDKLFSRFYRVSGTKEDTFPGMGLGLFISSEIIKRHKGSVTVKSAAGKGSTFYFTIPVRNMLLKGKINKSLRETTNQ